MKLLFLSACGRTKESEDNAYINLYLASLKKHVVPYFDVKVILFNNALTEKSSESLTFQRVKEFGLENVVEVKNMYEMGLPEESVKFLDSLHWFGKIGINMNMLFDYSKMHNFFDAEWIFHFDTDLEFLPNFEKVLTSINEVRKLNPQIIISAGGDTYPYNFRYKELEFIFDEPTRVNIYDASTLSHHFSTRNLRVNRRTEGSDVEAYINNERLVFNLQQQKVRNDFVGYSLEAAKRNIFNWVACYYPDRFEPTQRAENAENEKLLKKLWDEKGSADLQLIINHNFGSLPQFFLQGSGHDNIKIQVRGYQDMARHFCSGWFESSSFKQVSEKRLKEEYSDTQHIWESDYTSV